MRLLLVVLAAAGIGLGIVIVLFSAFLPFPFLFLRTPRNAVLTFGVGAGALVLLAALHAGRRRIGTRWS